MIKHEGDTEARMERVNIEINKVFGQQMASLFADRISEEELRVRSENAWREITTRPYKYGSQEASMLERLIKEKIIEKVMVQVDEIMKTPVAEEQIRKEAERIAAEAKKRAEELIVNSIANNITNMMLSNYSNFCAIESGCSKIAEAIMNHR